MVNAKYVHELISRITDRDELAFNEFFDIYYAKLIQIALAFVPGIVAAQEIVSDVFYKILKNPGNLDQVKNFDNYIFLTVRNQAFSYLKRNKRRLTADSIEQKEDYIIPDTKNPENSMISDELFMLVDKTVQKFPPKRKTVFMLVKEEGLKYREVAEILNISIKTVEVQMSLALKTLRSAVGDYLESKDVKIRRFGKGGFRNFLLSLFL